MTGLSSDSLPGAFRRGAELGHILAQDRETHFFHNALPPIFAVQEIDLEL
jgi:hypothetical protein